jgi:hypothetical protein
VGHQRGRLVALSVVSCQLGIGIQRSLFCLGMVKIPVRPDRPTEAFRPRLTEQVQSTDAWTQLASKSFLICATLTPNWRPTAPSLTPARMAFTQQKSRSDSSLRLLPFKDLGPKNGGHNYPHSIPCWRQYPFSHAEMSCRALAMISQQSNSKMHHQSFEHNPKLWR